MINTTNNNTPVPNATLDAPQETPIPVDTAHMDVQCHLLVKDVDSGEVLINMRG